MKFTSNIVKVEGYDDMGEGAFIIEAFDECCAKVEISTPVNAREFKAMADIIYTHLKSMDFVGDTE